MITSRQEYIRYLKEDCKVNIGRDNSSWFRMMVFLWYRSEHYRVLNYLKALRLYEYSLNCKDWRNPFLRYFAKVRWHSIGAKYGIVIDPNTVGYGLRIPHIVGGVIIHCESVGNNCVVNSGVIIGTNNKGGLARIGNNVDISVGSKIIGGVIIGDNSIVAPNSVVVKDVPANAIVSGVPANIIKFRE